MVARRRSSIMVLRDILTLGKGGKTRLMYGANLSHDQLEQYLGFLLDSQLVERMPSPRNATVYKRTPKGARVLQKIEELLGELDGEI